jgi:hypothetical protein
VLGPPELEPASVSPRFGRITAHEQIDEWAYHDLDHLRQLVAAIETDLYPRIAGHRRLYRPPFPSSSTDDGQLLPASAPAGSDRQNGSTRRWTTVAAEKPARHNPLHGIDSHLTWRAVLVGLHHFATPPLMIELM